MVKLLYYSTCEDEVIVSYDLETLVDHFVTYTINSQEWKEELKSNPPKDLQGKIAWLYDLGQASPIDLKAQIVPSLPKWLVTYNDSDSFEWHSNNVQFLIETQNDATVYNVIVI